MSASRRPSNRESLLNKLGDLHNEASLKKFVLRNPVLLRPKVVAELTERVREQVRVDVPSALRIANAALHIANQIKNGGARARALRAKANVLYAKGEHAAAIELHEQAVALFDVAGNANEVARTLSGSIQPLLLLGEYNRAFAAGERDHFNVVGENRSLRRHNFQFDGIRHV